MSPPNFSNACGCVHVHVYACFLSNYVAYANICLCCHEYSVTYNPRPLFSSVGLRTTRSLLTASERSTAIGITTGMIGTTGGKRRRCGKALAHFSTAHTLPPIYVGGSSKIQTLCHMIQVLLKLRLTAMERLSGY